MSVAAGAASLRLVVAVVGLALVVSLGLPPPAVAAPSASCDQPGDDGVVRCRIEEREVRVVDGGAASGDWPPSGWTLIEYPVLDHVEGTPCARRISRYLPPDERDPTKELEDQFDDDVGNLGDDAPGIDDCPSRVEDAPADPAEVVERFLAVITTRLPPPELSIAPASHALTGLPAYLETGARSLDVHETFTLPLPAGPVLAEARAAGSYRVDWGDGSALDGWYEQPGLGFPTGEVSHVYDATGTLAVRVTDAWDFTLWAPGLPPLQLEARLDHGPLEVRVEQYVGVRVTTP